MRISDRPELVAQLLEQLEDLRLDHDVEGGRRLVADDDRRVAGQGHRDHRPLAHAARQLVRVGAGPLACGMPDELEQLAGALARRVARLAQAHLDRLGDLVADAADRVERVHRALEHDARSRASGSAQLRSRSWARGRCPNELDRCPSRSSRSTAGAGRATGPSSSCRSRTRRRCPSASPSSSRKQTPSTALTEPSRARSASAGPRRRAAARSGRRASAAATGAVPGSRPRTHAPPQPQPRTQHRRTLRRRDPAGPSSPAQQLRVEDVVERVADAA